MNNWLENSISRAETIQDNLSLKRQQSLQQLKAKPWPTRKNEHWKYTPLKAIEQLQLPQQAANSEFSLPKVEDLEFIELVFTDGKLQSVPEQNDLPQGLHIYRFDDEQQKSNLNKIFDSIKPSKHYFGLVNDVLAAQGVLIVVDEAVNIDTPVRISNVVNQGADAHTRALVQLGKHASLTLIEQNFGNENSINTLFCEYLLSEKSTLNHYRFQTQSEKAIAIGGCHFQLQNQAVLNSNIVGFGSDLSRLDVDIDHAGQKAQANLNAMYLLDKNELFDLHTTVEHSVANGETNENIRGIIGGSAKAVFNGRIHIHPHAQKTEAKLNNRNLLLTNKAEVDTKPELEIYADDVRCAHGATVSQVDDKSLYYMQSRGIDKKQAQAMLNFGFINELLESMPHPEIASWLRPQIRQRFETMSNDSE